MTQINTNGSFICLSVLTENLFMDNIKDCAYLLTEEGRDLLAQITSTPSTSSSATTTAQSSRNGA